MSAEQEDCLIRWQEGNNRDLFVIAVGNIIIQFQILRVSASAMAGNCDKGT